MITFIDNGIRSNLKNKRNLKRFISNKIEEKGFSDNDISFVFCSDEFLLSINQKYLLHDDYTDTITFNLSSDNNLLFGEVYISIPRIKENSKTFGNTYEEELHRVMFHSLLHLFGEEDNTPEKKNNMKSIENQLLNDYFKLEKEN